MPDTHSDRLTTTHMIQQWRGKLVRILLRGTFYFALVLSLIVLVILGIDADWSPSACVTWALVAIFGTVAFLWVLAYGRLSNALQSYGVLVAAFFLFVWSLLDEGMMAEAAIYLIILIVYAFQVTWWLVSAETLAIIAMISVGASTLQDAFSGAYRGGQKALAEVYLDRELLEVRVAERTRELEQAYQQLQSNQEALLVSEKLASHGRLTAGIAHEMNTPLAAVGAALFELDELLDEFGNSIDDNKVSVQDRLEIAEEMRPAVRISKRSILRAMKFIRGIKSQTRQLEAGERQRFNARHVIKDTLMLFGPLPRRFLVTPRNR